MREGDGGGGGGAEGALTGCTTPDGGDFVEGEDEMKRLSNNLSGETTRLLGGAGE